MATPADIDPATLAAIQAQLSGQQAPATPTEPSFTLPPALAAKYGPPPTAPAAPQAPMTPQERMLSQGLINAGVPETVKPPQPAGAAAQAPVQGDFVKPTAPAWQPPTGGTSTASRAISTVSPGVRAEYDKALAMQNGLPEEEANAQISANERMASVIDRNQQQLGEQMRKAEAARRERSQALDAQMADYKRIQDEAANQKIDPDRWWGSKSGAEKAMGAIGIILGGFGGGSNNVAMKLMNDNISRDIDAQKANIAQKGKSAEGARNLYSMKLQQFGDENAADMATRAQMLEQFKVQLEAEALRTKSAPLIAQAHRESAQIALQQAEIHKGLEHWQQGGAAAAITKEDQARAAAIYEKGGMTPTQALQAALAIRGAAPSEGVPAIPRAGQKISPEDKAAQALANGAAPQALTLGERIESGASNLPVVGRLFQGTAGAQKGLALDASNVAAHGYAHKVLGARTPEAQREVAGPLIIKPSDSQKRIDQKIRLRKLVDTGAVSSEDAGRYLEPEEEDE